MASQPEIAIIIINFNSGKLTLLALEELSRSNSGECNIVVVDNASTDNSVKIIKEKFPLVNIIVNNENIGFGSACNIALNQIKEPYVLIQNPDAIISYKDIIELVMFLKLHPNAAAVGPKLTNSDGSLQPSVFRLPTLTQEILYLFKLKNFIPNYLMKSLSGTFLSKYFGQFDLHDKVKRVEMLIGAIILFRKRALDEVEGFDEKFFLYYEEKDLFKRLREKGYHIYFTPFAKGIHAIGESAKTIPELAFVSRYRSMILYHEKHSSKTVQKLIKYLITISMLLRKCVRLLQGLLSKTSIPTSTH